MTGLALAELQFDAKVKSSIELKNESVLDELVKAVEKKYSDLIYTDENEKDAKKDRADLNKVVKQIDNERKKIKKEFNAPLIEFEEKLKGYSSRISKVINPIDEGIKDLEKRQKEQRLTEIAEYIKEVAPNYGVDPNEITIEPNWLNKSHSNIQRQRLVTDAMTLLKQQKEHKANEINIVISYCKALNLEPDAWLIQLEQGKSSAEIMKMIDESIRRKKEQEELERQAELKKEEAKRQAELKQEELRNSQKEEYEKELQRIKDNSQELDEKVVNVPEQGEPVQEFHTLLLKFTATSEQLDLLSQFIVDNDIQAEKI